MNGKSTRVKQAERGCAPLKAALWAAGGKCVREREGQCPPYGPRYWPERVKQESGTALRRLSVPLGRQGAFFSSPQRGVPFRRIISFIVKEPETRQTPQATPCKKSLFRLFLSGKGRILSVKDHFPCY